MSEAEEWVRRCAESRGLPDERIESEVQAFADRKGWRLEERQIDGGVQAILLGDAPGINVTSDTKPTRAEAVRDMYEALLLTDL